MQLLRILVILHVALVFVCLFWLYVWVIGMYEAATSLGFKFFRIRVLESRYKAWQILHIIKMTVMCQLCRA